VAELVAQLAVAAEALEQPVDLRVDRPGDAFEGALACERNGQNLGFDLLGSDLLDFNSHSRAMLADGLRSLRPHEGG
jgi:hypothetical protein